ncbi:MAG: hypothetical protein HY816_20070 [Candidatus Wallbacteria bacterium]|nr:hypothetical protein [Candidatus Wallbacteria bacterium]
MPQEHEAEWKRAKVRVQEKYPHVHESDHRFWRLVQAIYAKMTGGPKVKKSVALVLPVLSKGLVRGHYRTLRGGKRVWVGGYDSRRVRHADIARTLSNIDLERRSPHAQVIHQPLGRKHILHVSREHGVKILDTNGATVSSPGSLERQGDEYVLRHQSGKEEERVSSHQMMHSAAELLARHREANNRNAKRLYRAQQLLEEHHGDAQAAADAAEAHAARLQRELARGGSTNQGQIDHMRVVANMLRYHGGRHPWEPVPGADQKPALTAVDRKIAEDYASREGVSDEELRRRTLAMAGLYRKLGHEDFAQEYEARYAKGKPSEQSAKLSAISSRLAGATEHRLRGPDGHVRLATKIAGSSVPRYRLDPVSDTGRVRPGMAGSEEMDESRLSGKLASGEWQFHGDPADDGGVKAQMRASAVRLIHEHGGKGALAHMKAKVERLKNDPKFDPSKEGHRIIRDSRQGIHDLLEGHVTGRARLSEAEPPAEMVARAKTLVSRLKALLPHSGRSEEEIAATLKPVEDAIADRDAHDLHAAMEEAGPKLFKMQEQMADREKRKLGKSIVLGSTYPGAPKAHGMSITLVKDPAKTDSENEGVAAKLLDRIKKFEHPDGKLGVDAWISSPLNGGIVSSVAESENKPRVTISHLWCDDCRRLVRKVRQQLGIEAA